MHINDLALDMIEDALVSALFNEHTSEAIDKAIEVCREIRSSVATDLQLDEARLEWAGTDDLNIDSDASTSLTDEGYWVQCWAWVHHHNEDMADG